MAKTTKDKLTALFTRVKTSHIAFEEAQKQAFERALDAGKAIIEILALRDTLTKTEQAKMGATDWQKYITAETGVPSTSAKRYVKIAENEDIARKGFMDGVGMKNIVEHINEATRPATESTGTVQEKPAKASGTSNGSSASDSHGPGFGEIETAEDTGLDQTQSAAEDDDDTQDEQPSSAESTPEWTRFVNWEKNLYVPFKDKTVATFNTLEARKAAYELVIRDFQSMLDVIQKAIDNNGNVVSLPRRADTSNKKPEPTTIEELNV